MDVGLREKCLNGVHPQKNFSNSDGDYEFPENSRTKTGAAAILSKRISPMLV